MYFIISDVQELLETSKNIAEDLEETTTNCKNFEFWVTEEIQYKIAKLCKELKENVLSPYDLFHINREAFMAIVSTALTYIIVLMQFKSFELPLVERL